MSGHATAGQAMTGRQLRAAVHHIARTYLEVERGLRSPRHLAALLTKAEYGRHQRTKLPRPVDTSPVRPHHIGRVRIDATGRERINASVSVQRGEDHWSALVVDLRRTGRGWQVDRLGRLEHLLPLQARQIEIADNTVERRGRFIEEERRLVKAARDAVERRYEQSHDKRTSTARELRRQRDQWNRRLAATESEVATVLGPRPAVDVERETAWEAGARALTTYLDQCESVGADRDLLQAAPTADLDNERRRLLRNLASFAQTIGSEIPGVSERGLDAVQPDWGAGGP